MEKHGNPSRGLSCGDAAHRTSGFTLVELTMVVAITAVIASIAVPRFFNSATRYKLDAAARRLTGDIEYAQQEAIASSSSRTLTFNYLARTYTISRLDENGDNVVISTVSLNEGPYQTSALAASIAGNASNPIKFDGFGKPNGAGTIQLRNGTDRKVITLDGVTGRMSVK